LLFPAQHVASHNPADTNDEVTDARDEVTDTHSLLDVQAHGVAGKHFSSTTEQTPRATDDYEFEDYDLLFPESDSDQTPDTTTQTNVELANTDPLDVQSKDVAEKHFAGTTEETAQAAEGDDFEDFDILFSDSDSGQTPNNTLNVNGFDNTQLPYNTQLEGLGRKHFSSTTKDITPTLAGEDFEDYDILFSDHDSVHTPEDTIDSNESESARSPASDQSENAGRKHFSSTAAATIPQSQWRICRFRHSFPRRASRHVASKRHAHGMFLRRLRSTLQ